MSNMINNTNLKNEEIAIKLLLEAIYMKYGYDFRNYSYAHIKRRVLYKMAISNIDNVFDLIEKTVTDSVFFQELMNGFSINTTEMFRDPSFFKRIRNVVIPILKTFPFIRIWHAGCSTGEEVYSMSILLKEEGVYEKCQIYATDFNEEVLQTAKDGKYSAESISEMNHNYLIAGGKSDFSNYYVKENDSIIFNLDLKEKIVFASHNLVTDGVFGEMHMIICRNVLIYFNGELKNQVIKLFRDSLSDSGFLCLGSKEGIEFTEFDKCVDIISSKDKIYKMISMK
jgi:chemotaxis protein methyltransferase CheR